MTQTIKQAVVIKGIADRPVVMDFNRPAQSSDGGLVLLKSLDERLGLTRKLAAAIFDRRQAAKVEYPVREMIRERIFAIAAGYADCNDVTNRLGTDPVMKMMCDATPLSQETLASQPTLSRFENAMRRTDLMRLAYGLAEFVIERERKKHKGRRVRRIFLDMDPVDDLTHGAQQMTFFNTYYGGFCYLPMVTTIQFDGESQRLLVPVLRPGNSKGFKGAVAILKRGIPMLRQAFPKAQIVVRLDGGFAAPEVFDWLDGQGLAYLVNIGKNPVLVRKAEPLLSEVRERVKKSGHTEKRYGKIKYQAGKWTRARTVVVKAEVVTLDGREQRDNPRFVVTTLSGSAREIYETYAQRGDCENRIKELKNDLEFDRTSCTKFTANQARNIFTAAAYVLYQSLRDAAAGTEFERAQVVTLREKLIKIGITAIESIRRILLEGPLSYPWVGAWRKIARCCGAMAG